MVADTICRRCGVHNDSLRLLVDFEVSGNLSIRAYWLWGAVKSRVINAIADYMFNVSNACMHAVTLKPNEFKHYC